MKRVRVRYFAALREQAGRADELISTDCETAGALYASLKARHGFRIEPQHLRVAINDRFESMSVPLSPGDDVMFLPPVAGG
ncbi:MAG: MoaD/ThiS family protein [bacterium]